MRPTAYRSLLACVAAATLGAGLIGCNSQAPTTNSNIDQTKANSMQQPMPATTSLYERLGGEEAITKVVDDLVTRAAADSRVNFTRQGHPHTWDPNADDNMAHLKQGLVAFFTQATGGPSNYHGRSMTEAHQGMQISESEWSAFAEDLKATLDHLNVAASLQAELLNVVGTTHDQIVGK